MRLPVPKAMKFDVVNTIRSDWAGYQLIEMDGLRIENETGWALIRPSNTEPVITVRIEATEAHAFQQWIATVKKSLDTASVDTSELENHLQQ